MLGPFTLDGYDVLAPLGSGERTWKAVSLADGARVVLRRLRGGEAERARIRREAAQWGSIAGGHVIAVRDVVAHDGEIVVVSDLASGGGLDRLLARRGALRPGEIVTLVVPLAETLRRAHGRGLVHGRVSAGNIVIDAFGRPMLADAAVSPSDAGTPDEDVTALVRAATAALGAADSGPVAAALASVPAAAAELAEAVRAAAPATPVAVADPRAVRPVPAVAATSPPTRRRALPVVTAAFAAAIALGVLWGNHDSASGARLGPAPIVTATPTPTPTPIAAPAPTAAPVTTPATPPRSWRAIVARLERARIAALATRSVDALARVDAPHSPALRHDLGIVGELRRQALRPTGVHVHVDAVTPVVLLEHLAELRVVDALSAYSLVRPDGRVVARHQSRPGRAVLLTLQRHGDRWLLRRASRRWL